MAQKVSKFLYEKEMKDVMVEQQKQDTQKITSSKGLSEKRIQASYSINNGNDKNDLSQFAVNHNQVDVIKVVQQ